MEFICLLWLFCGIFLNTSQSSESIRYAAVLYRHGDRTPVNMYPTDPYKNESLWPVKFGQLTNTGKLQHYALGQWLRNRYNNLISTKFDPAEIYVRSTNIDRTLMSALANLAGMYPPIGDSIWNPNLNWQPIPVHTVPVNEDNVLSMEKECQNYDIEKNLLINSEEYKKGLQMYETLMKYLSSNVGYEVTDYADILAIYSVLKIEKLYNFTLPDWTLKVFPNQMAVPAAYSFTVDTATPLMARLKVGPFIKEVVYNMFKTIQYYDSMNHNDKGAYNNWNGEPPLKLSIYSAHDLTIGSVLNGLLMFDGKCPEYTSTILFELVYDDNIQNHFVRILYRNTTKIEDPHVLYIPHCGYRCPLERFAQLYRDIMPVNWEDECAPKFLAKMTLACIFVLVVIFTLLIVYAHPFCKYDDAQYD